MQLNCRDDHRLKFGLHSGNNDGLVFSWSAGQSRSSTLSCVGDVGGTMTQKERWGRELLCNSDKVISHQLKKRIRLRVTPSAAPEV